MKRRNTKHHFMSILEMDISSKQILIFLSPKHPFISDSHFKSNFFISQLCVKLGVVNNSGKKKMKLTLSMHLMHRLKLSFLGLDFKLNWVVCLWCAWIVVIKKYENFKCVWKKKIIWYYFIRLYVICNYKKYNHIWICICKIMDFYDMFELVEKKEGRT